MKKTRRPKTTTLNPSPVKKKIKTVSLAKVAATPSEVFCQNEARRRLLREQRTRTEIHGLDYVEVEGGGKTLHAFFIGKLPETLKSDPQKLKSYVRIEGGRRVRDIKVLEVRAVIEKDPDEDDALVVKVDKAGDFSTYTLRLVNVPEMDPIYDHADFSFKVDCPSDLDCALPAVCPPETLDEPDINYLAKDYSSFRQLILDRLSLIMPEWKERHVPDIGITLVELLAYVGDHLSYYQDSVATEAYLDTARQRISLRRHTRLVDYFMHEGCNARTWLALSILDTPSFSLDLSQVNFFAQVESSLAILSEVVSPDEFREFSPDSVEIFEPVLDTPQTLWQVRNEIHFYTWGEQECCLPRGSTSASLLDTYQLATPPAPGSQTPPAERRTSRGARQAPPESGLAQPPKWAPSLNLMAGDVLIFEEVIGPKTGNPADADPAHRTAVRLTKVTLNHDPLVMVTVKDGDQEEQLPTPVVDIEWHTEDALSFPLCLSSVTAAPDCLYVDPVSVARGNVILVDHGRRLSGENIGSVPLAKLVSACDCGGRTSEVAYLPDRFNPRLKYPGLTYRQPLPADDLSHQKWNSAAGLLRQDPRSALPQVRLDEVPAAPGDLQPLFTLADLVDPSELVERMRDPSDEFGALLLGKLNLKTQNSIQRLKPNDQPTPSLLADVSSDLSALMRSWESRYDLLSSGPEDLQFVVEVDNDAVAHLRFGDNDLGEQPPAGSTYYANYRVGNGTRGNLGAESISHTVLNLNGARLYARNPLPTVGGVDAEPMSEARLYAPFAFRKQRERAIIADDYAEIAQREFSLDLQGAAAHLDWTGSWYEAEVALDPFNSEAESLPLEQAVCQALDSYRRMGHDLRVEKADYVPLDIELQVCVDPEYLRGQVKAVLLNLFSNRPLPDGTAGLFHPDRLVFGEDIYLSRLVAEAQRVEGVLSVTVSKLERLYEGPNQELENGVLPLGPFEIARLDNDPDFPENGHLNLVMTGGR